jgi:hypothetical protein
MRDEVGDSPTDDQLLDALTTTTVALCAGADVLALPQAQTAFVTIVMLAARSGHRIHLMAPNARLASAQPPFRGSHLISALMEADGDLLPLRQFTTDAPVKPVDICITFDGAKYFDARHTLDMSASAWATRLTARQHPPLWSQSNNWPLGALAGSTIVAGEIFKASMHKLRNLANNPTLFDPLFEPVDDLNFALAPDASPTPSALGTFECISGGAISNAALYVLSRISGAEGLARVIEPELADHSNLNRYAFLRLSDIPASKAPLLAAQDLGLLKIDPIEDRFDESFSGRFGPIAARILVGVDHIPSRWAAQKADPAWLGIGATTHWDAMVSFHVPGLPCAGCLHPIDDNDQRNIPTVAFVSFAAGLMLASYFLRAAGGERISPGEQQSYLTAFRPDSLWRSAAARDGRCPLRH